MNTNDTPSGENAPITPELEARVVAWVEGEASEAEASLLAQVAAERPEVAALKRRLEEARLLISRAVRPDGTPLRLSEGRREELMRALSAPAPRAEGPSLAAIRQKQRRERQVLLAAAACLTCGVFLTFLFRSENLSLKDGAKMEARAELLEARQSVSQEKEQVITYKRERLSEEAASPVAVSLPAMPADEAPEAEAPAPGSVAKSARILNTARSLAAAPAFDSGSLGVTARDLPAAAVSLSVAAPKVVSAESSIASFGEVSNPIPHTFGAYRSAPAAADAIGGAVLDKKASGTGGPAPFSAIVPEGGTYAANPTLAGTRLRSDLKDAGSSVNVVTAQFLQEAPPAAESNASKDPFSTFSLHVGDVSFKLAREALARGELPAPSAVRPEEFYNAFDYGDPTPAMAEKVSCRTEQAADPFAQQRNLLRIAMRVPATGRDGAQPLRLTVLVDTSGSMEREDRRVASRRAMEVLVSLLRSSDRITLIGFARTPRLLADQVPGDKAGAVLDTLARTPSEGGTNLEEAIRLAGELAGRQFLASAQNRVVLLTDGVTNLGDAVPAHLSLMVEALRQKGIAFDACGIGGDGIDDQVLEALTRKGSGRYYVVNSPEDADSGFAAQLAGALRPAAENVKVQVRFNPSRVGSYRLVGFDQHRLATEDFRDDAVAAAALAAGENAVALYEVEPLPQGEGELGEVFVRFRDATTGAVVERSWTLPYEPAAPALDRAAPSMQLAGAAALLAEKLQGGPRSESIRLGELAPVLASLRNHYSHAPRVQDLAAMYEQVRRIRRE